MNFVLPLFEDEYTKDVIVVFKDKTCTEFGYHVTCDASIIFYYRFGGKFEIEKDSIKFDFPNDEIHFLSDGSNRWKINGHIDEVLERESYRQDGKIELNTAKDSKFYVSGYDYKRLIEFTK
ncbi:MAG: hypothetical protein AAB966_03105 [Patescibacteria group bacterium]